GLLHYLASFRIAGPNFCWPLQVKISLLSMCGGFSIEQNISTDIMTTVSQNNSSKLSLMIRPHLADGSVHPLIPFPRNSFSPTRDATNCSPSHLSVRRPVAGDRMKPKFNCHRSPSSHF